MRGTDSVLFGIGLRPPLRDGMNDGGMGYNIRQAKQVWSASKRRKRLLVRALLIW